MYGYRKKFGKGTLSLLLFVLGALLLLTSGVYGVFEGYLLNGARLFNQSNSEAVISRVVLVSFIIHVVAVIVGSRYREDWGATAGEYLSAVSAALTLFIYTLYYGFAF